MKTRRREFLGSLAVGLTGTRLAGAQAGGRDAPPVPVRKAKTTALFKSPEGYPNAIAVSPEGLWIGEQKTDNACLVDWNGKLLKTVKTESKNTSGMGVGGGYIWMGANAAPNGIFQTDMNARTISQLRCRHPSRLAGKQEPDAWLRLPDRPVDLAHAASADQRQDFVRAKARAFRKP